MKPTNQSYKVSSRHANAEWPPALRGTLGESAQQMAFDEMTSYLHTVAYNYLKSRADVSDTLNARTNDEIATLAEDHVYDFVERIVRDDFALLDRYNGTGRFLAWCTQILRNDMVSKMRRSSWRKQMPMTESIYEQTYAPQATQPEQATLRENDLAIMWRGIETLPERHRIALTRRLLDGDSAQSVADDFGTTQNAINVLVYRAKAKLRTYLIAKGLDRTVVNSFA